MKNKVVAWLAVQVFSCVLIDTHSHNEMIDGSYDCHPLVKKANIVSSAVVGVAFPLLFLWPLDFHYALYCEEKAREAREAQQKLANTKE